MPSLKKVRAQLVGFATVLVLALGLGAAPASAAVDIVIDGVGYVINGSGEAVASMYTSDLPADLSIPTSVRLAGSTYPVTQIGGAVFAYANDLVAVTIPASVTSIGRQAFAFDSALTSIRFLGASPSIAPEALSGVASTVYFFSRFGADAVDGGFTTPIWQGLNTVAVDEKLTLTPNPVISGVATVGEVLSVDAGEWDSGVSLTYQWNRDGVAIDGETGLTYSLTGVDGGSVISVSVLASKPYFLGIASISEATAVVQRPVVYDIDHVKRNLSQLKPTITGWSKVGQSLRVVTDEWSRSRNLSFQWFANGKRIAGATARTYTLQAGQVGARVSVRVTWRKSSSSVIARTTVKRAKIKP